MNKTTDEISEFLAKHIAHYAELAIDQIDINKDISSFRVDSILMVNITSELEDWLSISLNPAILWEMGTIAATSEWIVENEF